MNTMSDYGNTIPTLRVDDAALVRQFGYAARRENRTIPVVPSALLFAPAGTTR